MCYLQKEEIQRKFSHKYTPQQNSVVERKNMTIVEAYRVMLEEKHMPKVYCVEAFRKVVYLLNRGATRKAQACHFGRKPKFGTLMGPR